MRIFISQQPSKTVSHPTLKKAAGSVTFAARFFDHRFATDDAAIADALAGLVDAGALPDVKEVTPNAEPQATTGGASSGKGKGAANGAN